MRIRNTHHTKKKQSVELLNKHLAAAIDLHAQVKQAHWNVRGPAFIAVHELFDKVSAEVEEFSDMLAERAGALGGTAHGTLQTAAKETFLKPYKLGIASEKEHIEAIASALALFGDSIRDSIGKSDDIDDPTTADLFTQISRGVDQQLWFIESHNH